MEPSRKDKVNFGDDHERDVSFTEYEITVTAEAVREFLLNKLYWGLFRAPVREVLAFGIYQRIVKASLAVYGRMTMLSMPDVPEGIDREWMERASLSPKTWEVLDNIEQAMSWDDVPFHKLHRRGCGLCDDMMSVPSLQPMDGTI